MTLGCDHHAVASLRVETRHLVLTEMQREDLRDVLAVRLSNADRLARTEGSAGDSGAYDLSMLERDMAVVVADPARHVLVARARADGRVVGYVDVLDEHPDDGCPWLGVVEIQADDHRRGFGRQCVDAVAGRAHEDLKARAFRAAADVDDVRAQAFLRALRFVSVGSVERSSPRGRVPVILWERALVRE
jgi:RimJ/RimL family protein N-acetyltransferase